MKFYFYLLRGASPLISDLFWLYFNDSYLKNDCSLLSVFQYKHVAITDMYEQFIIARK